tara:strand:- start:234 stop:503 length:270 start_codon:yes stop_codon:yes gene_type:complete
MKVNKEYDKVIYDTLNQAFMYIAETDNISKTQLLDNLEMCCDIMEQAMMEEMREAWERYYKDVHKSDEDFIVALGFAQYLSKNKINPTI